QELCREAAALAARRYIESLEAGNRPGIGQMRRMMDRAVRDVDPDGVARRRNEAKLDRGVWIRQGADGMASVSATLTAQGAELLGERLDQMAGTGTWARGGRSGAREDADRDPSDAADDRSPDLRRADALVELATAGPAGPAVPLRRRVTVVLTGDGECEVFVRRAGETSLAALPELLDRARGATFETVFTGRPGADRSAELRYAIPRWLARRVRLR